MRSILKLHRVAMLSLGLAALLTSCIEDDSAQGLTLFGCSYKELPPGTMASGVQNAARAVDPGLEAGSDRFLPEDIGGFGAANNVELDGDPTTSQSSLTIRMNREPRNEHSYPRTMTMQLFGPFTEGQTYTSSDGEAEISLGHPIDIPGSGITEGPRYSTDSGQGTYLELNLTSLDIPNERVGGTFHFLAKRIVGANENPDAHPAIIVFDGSFSSGFNP